MRLNIFNQIGFLPALKLLFKELNVPVNYVSDEPTSAKHILTDTYKDNATFELIDEVYFCGMVDDAAFEGNLSLSVEKIKSDYDGILIFGITLKDRGNNLLPTRSQLADISRAFNCEYYYTPVLLVFKYGNHIAFANTKRIKYKQEWREGEKAGKVTLLRDINIKAPHSGHERILAELTLPTSEKNKITSFNGLYKYWQEVFSVDVLNKKFYQELSTWYFWATKHVTFPSEPTPAQAHLKNAKLDDLLQQHKATNVIRMLTRLLFVWFIKEKGLIPEELFDLDTLQKDILNDISPFHESGMFKHHNKDSIYYKAILQNLFFATLNCPIEGDEYDKRKRGFRGEGYGTHRGIDYLMRYKQYFKNPDKFLDMLNAKVPFLNGGLFECLDDKFKNVYIDGFSDQMVKGEQLVVPDYLFFGVDEETDISDIVGIADRRYKNAHVKGLINILKSYKFTITENTPIEEDIALDPELLGKVFENLLASYNPETKTTARKQTGSFYTPREIVNYMVDESLIAYLKNKIQQEQNIFKELGIDQTNLFGNLGKKGQQTLQNDLSGSELRSNELLLEDSLKELISFNPGNPFRKFPNITKTVVDHISKCTILDPACGSGAFPMGILQKMVHILQKLDPDNKAWRNVQESKAKKDAEEAFDIEDKVARGERLIEINEAFDQSINDPDYARKLFLIENCIYGVDIQPIATQISKLRFFISLIVEQKVNPDKPNFGIRPLPNLETKFVAANTLIGVEKPNAQLTLYDTKEIKILEAELKKVRSKLFSAKSKDTKLKYRQRDEELRNAIAVELEKSGWKSSTAQKLAGWDPYDQNGSSTFFDPEWMFDISKGFNIVIGNPPYVFTRDVEFDGNFKQYIEDEYFSKMIRGKKSKSNQSGKINLFAVFIIKGFWLSSQDGYLSFIVPNNILRTTTYDVVRRYILENAHVDQIVDLGSGVFDNVTASTVVIGLSNQKTIFRTNVITGISNLEQGEFNTKVFDQSQFLENVSFSFNIYMDEIALQISKAIAQDRDLLDTFCFENIEGIIAHKHLIFDENANNRVPLIEGKDVKRFFIRKPSNFLLWDTKEIHRTRPDYLWTAQKKIIIQRISGGTKPLVCSVDENRYKSFASTNNLLLKEKYQQRYYFIAALINSDVLNWYYANNFSNNSTLTVNISKTYMDQLPIANFSESISLMSEILHYLSGDILSKEFEVILNAMIFESYFSEHMRQKEIDVLTFIENSINQILGKKTFRDLDDIEKQKVIGALHEIWLQPDSQVRNRIKLFAVRSPEILRPILES